MSGNVSDMLGTARVKSAAIRGARAVPIDITASIHKGGIPGLSVVGIPESRTVELRQRVRCALRSSGFELPRAAGEVRIDRMPECSTAGVELPVAVAILAASGQIPSEWLRGCSLFGDLGLDGDILPVRGAVAVHELARREGLELVTSAGSRGIPDEGPRAIGASSISELRSGMPGRELAPMARLDRESADASALRGNFRLKTCLAVAAAGRVPLHIAPDEGMDAWNPFAAQVLADIMGPPDPEEELVAARMASIMGDHDAFVARPVVRVTLDHAIPGIIGGGRPLVPGAASAAASGVLVFDGFGGDQTGRDVWMDRVARSSMRGEAIELVRASGRFELPSPRSVIAFEREGSRSMLQGDALKARIERPTTAEPDPGPHPGRLETTADLKEAVERARWFARTCASREAPDRSRASAVDLAARTLADMDESANIGGSHRALAFSLTSSEMAGPRPADAPAETRAPSRRGMRP